MAKFSQLFFTFMSISNHFPAFFYRFLLKKAENEAAQQLPGHVLPRCVGVETCSIGPYLPRDFSSRRPNSSMLRAVMSGCGLLATAVSSVVSPESTSTPSEPAF